MADRTHRQQQPGEFTVPAKNGSRPLAAVIMGSEHWETQFGPAQRLRLRQLVDLVEPASTSTLGHPDLAGQLADLEVLVTGWGAMPLTVQVLDQMPRLRGLFHCAGSVRGLLPDEVWERDITVSTSADLNADPVAEFTLAAIIMAGKRAPFLAAELRINPEHDGHVAGVRGAVGNTGRTIGVIGFSRIGRRVVQLLRQTLQQVTCLVFDPYADPREVADSGAHLVSLEELLPRVDILTLHAPLLPSTRHMIGAAELAAVSDGAVVINTARGALIDAAALEAELVSGRLSAILDVTDPEPLPPTSPLYTLASAWITPHIAGATGTETQRMADGALDELARFLSGQQLVRQLTREAFEVSA